MIFYHTTTPEHWGKYADHNHFEADSLYSEGFIHASFEEQLDDTLKIHFKDIPKVIILKIDEALLEPELKVEKSRNGQFFPHIYGKINKSAITEIEEREL
jgi:uncharacterized protein (DUF952 family)